MAKTCLITLADDDLVNGSTATWDVPNADPEYAAENVTDFNPQNVTKAGAATADLTISHGGGTPLIVGIMNHNLPGRAVQLVAVGGGGGTQSLTIPARSADDQCTNVFFDLRLTAGLNASNHAIAIQGGSGPPAIGRVCLPTAVYTVRWQVGKQGAVEYEIEWPNNAERTYLELDLTYDRGIRLRRAGGLFAREADRLIAQAVMMSSHGINKPFMFVPDITVNDCWYAKVDHTSLKWQQKNATGNVLSVIFAVAELSMGLVLD
jgi:hypothetical protein